LTVNPSSSQERDSLLDSVIVPQDPCGSFPLQIIASPECYLEGSVVHHFLHHLVMPDLIVIDCKDFDDAVERNLGDEFLGTDPLGLDQGVLLEKVLLLHPEILPPMHVLLCLQDGILHMLVLLVLRFLDLEVFDFVLVAELVLFELVPNAHGLDVQVDQVFTVLPSHLVFLLLNQLMHLVEEVFPKQLIVQSVLHFVLNFLLESFNFDRGAFVIHAV